MVGRNAPCPCRSGKKYKRCCAGKGEAFQEEQVELALNRILLGSFEEISRQVKFAEFEMVSNEWKRELEDLWDMKCIEEAISAYYILVAKRDLWLDYVATVLKSTLRSTVRDVVETWRKPIILLGTIQSVQEDYFEIKELLGSETYLLQKNDSMNESIGAIVYGIVLRDNRIHENGVGSVSSVLMMADEESRLANKVIALARKEDDGYAIAQHMLDIYVTLLNKQGDTPVALKEEVIERVVVESIKEEVIEVDTDERDLTPIQQETLDLLNHTLVERDATLEECVRLTDICSQYFMINQPNFRKANVVAAAAFQTAINLELLAEEPMTNSAAAKIFEVSPASITTHMNNIRTFIEGSYVEVEEETKELHLV